MTLLESRRPRDSAGRPHARREPSRVRAARFALASLICITPMSMAAASPSPSDAVNTRADPPSWERLEDLRILTNEEPAEYAPRLEALLKEFRTTSTSRSLELARQEGGLDKIRRAGLTLARAQLGLGDREAALRTLEIVQRENIGVEVDFEAMGPSLAALAEALDPKRGQPPAIICASACVVLMQGRIVPLDTEGAPQSLRVPLGHYEIILAAATDPGSAASLSARSRTTVVVESDGADPAILQWPPPEKSRALDSDDLAEAEGDSTRAVDVSDGRARKRAALALGVAGGALVVIGAVLVGATPGCSSQPCWTSPAALTGLAAIGAGVPLAAGALGIGLARDPRASPGQVSGYHVVVRGRF